MAIPPLFTNFGKNANDLFKKKYDFDPISFKTVRKAANDLTIETGGVSVAADAKKKTEAYLRAYSKLTASKTSFGSAELELHTDPIQTTKLSAKFSKLYPGFILNVALASKDKADFFKDAKYVASAEGIYSQNSLQGQLAFKSDGAAKHKVDGSLSLSYNQFIGGGSVSIDSEHALTEVQDLQVGGEYSQDDLTFSLYSSIEKGTRYVNGSYFQRVSRDLAAGFLVKFDTSNKTADVTIGNDYRLDVGTGVKAKVELPKGLAQIAVEHRLASPQALIGLATEFDVSNPQAPAAGKFGLSFTFGDF